jgi:uncharacterized protein YndB with AHSA1/START domain
MKVIAIPGTRVIYHTRTPLVKSYLIPYRSRTLHSMAWPSDLKTSLKTFEPRSGGKWRMFQRQWRNKYSFHGFYHEVSAPELIISTLNTTDSWKGHVYLEKIRFDALSKLRTKLSYQVIFTSVEDRDFMLQSGMERDIEESYGRLDAFDKKKTNSNIHWESAD